MRLERHYRTEHDDRQGDADFDEGKINAVETKRTAGRHHGDEARRDKPQRATAEMSGEEADRHHGQHVIEASDRVHEAVYEPRGVANARVGVSRLRHQGREHRNGNRDIPFHCIPHRTAQRRDNTPA